jgi:hypothetical protein
MSTRTILLAGIAASLIAAPAVAHHSFAMFDATKTVTMNGTVKSFEWTNPHMWLTVTVDGTDYPLEMQGNAGAVRFGWKRDSVKSGDKITVDNHPLRDGTHGGQWSAWCSPAVRSSA